MSFRVDDKDLRCDENGRARARTDRPWRERQVGDMGDIDPYDPALKYPQEWDRDSRLAALKCWRDGNKTDQAYWMKDHKWEVLHSVELTYLRLYQ